MAWHWQGAAAVAAADSSGYQIKCGEGAEHKEMKQRQGMRYSWRMRHKRFKSISFYTDCSGSMVFSDDMSQYPTVLPDGHQPTVAEGKNSNMKVTITF